MVINYKEVNKNTKFDGYNIQKWKKYYSKFDCKSKFWQITMDNNSIPITTFSTPRCHYKWMVMTLR